MKIGIIGCGNMGEAILKGIVAERITSHRNIRVSDEDSTKLVRIKKSYHVETTFNNILIADKCDVIIVAVKPQDIRKVLGSISGSVTAEKLLISVAAGVTIKKINSFVGKNVPVARVMPNMPALINKGFSAISFSKSVDRNSAKLAKSIFACIGDVAEVKENDMDAITAVSGSGPAYFFYLVELLVASGVKLGLARSVARDAAFKTALGSAELLNRLGEEPSSLRKRVTSKGGTTEAAFKVFKKNRLGAVLEKGIKAAKLRSKELQGG